MGKKSCWFTFVTRFFQPESKPKSEEKPKKKIWFLEMFKFKQYPAAIQAPDTTINEATEEQHMRALAVAVATAAAAEAAIAAANAAAELVRLTHVPYELERKKQYLAAVKIQSVYRGHLGRKALGALKGIVILQAVVRGELARKHIIRRLAALSLLSKPKPHVRKERVLTLFDYLNHGETRHCLGPEERNKPEEARLKCSSGRGWDLSTVSEEGLESFYQRKQEGIDRRERMKQYSYSHRERRNEQSLQEALACKENRYSSRFDRCYELKPHQHEEKERGLKPLSHSRTIAVDHISRLAQLNYKEDMLQEPGSPFSLPRRSLSHVKQRSIGDEGSLPNSPVYPAYMAATESAKAKTRSMSTPKQRLRLCDTYSGHGSPYSFRLSAWNSFNGDMTNGSKRNSVSRQMSAN